MNTTNQSRLRELFILLGVPVDNLTMNEALDRLEGFVAVGRRTGRTHQVATVNTDFIVNAAFDPLTRRILQGVDMAVADGMPVVWGARRLGYDLKERVAGADLIPLLAERAALRGFSVYFLGAAPGVSARAAQILCERYPGLKVAGTYSPPYFSTPEMDSDLCEQVRRANPDILLVAFGNPKQEKWIAMHRRQLGTPVQIGVGGTLDFITGETRRAPAWMQRIGLEWLHRLLKNPGRLWRRYVKDFFVFGFLLARERLRLKRNKPFEIHGQITFHPAYTGEKWLALVQGSVTAENLELFSVQAAGLLDETKNLVFDLSGAVYLDCAAIGSLVHLAKEARARGGDLILASVPNPIRRALAALGLEDYFQVVPSLERAFNNIGSTAEALSGPWITDQTAERGETGWEVIFAPRWLDTGSAPEIKE